jgi:ABC-type transport system involved in Fe-S cluster assembly fused permease/ATPase subunit
METDTMNVYVLEAQIPYEGSVTMGVYTTREGAEAAAKAFEASDAAQQFPTGYDYYVQTVVLDAGPRERWGEGESVDLDD